MRERNRRLKDANKRVDKTKGDLERDAQEV